MVLLYSSELFVEHNTGRAHPERPERVSHALEHLRRTGLAERCEAGRWEALNREQLLGVHTREQVEQSWSISQRGGGRIDSDTVLSSRSFEVAVSAAGAAVAAVDAVLLQPRRRAFCLIRPPGHHATQNRSMGFCLFNSIALAAHHAANHHKLDRILIVDWDVHHGNGTQDIFYADPRVMFFSIHRYPFYPGTGAANETGTGPGLGFTRNEPVAFGTPRAEYMKRFERALTESADKIRPQLILLSAGFDAHAQDPIGSLGLENEDFAAMTQLVLQVADHHCNGQLVSLLEGGYNIPVLAESIQAHLLKLIES